MRRRSLVLLLALCASLPLAAQKRPTMSVALPAAGSLGTEGPTVRAWNVLGDRSVRDLLRNGFPAQLHFRVELWTSGGIFNSLIRSAEWDIVLRYDALREIYEAVRVVRDSAIATVRYTQFADAVAEVERAVRAPILPAPERGRQYYNATMTLEMLSVNDLDEVVRWLRGELRPTLRGQKNPATAVGRGVQKLLVRMLGGESRTLESRSPTFRVRAGQ